ncbi:MAG: prolipoprotein diacylglyceryl transferase [Pseudomonadota bacterium]
MPFVLPYPNIDPVLVTIELFGLSLPIRWYALAYLAALFIGLWLMKRLMDRPTLWPANQAPMTKDQTDALLTWIVIGVILGGRLGFVLFYQIGFYIENPSLILQIWQGGMSFHGGFAGVIVALLIFCRRQNIPLMQVADAMAIVAPQGLLLGRLANFINGELWGRTTDVPWAMVFPGAGDLARHPSQLYQAFFEGLLLFVLIWVLATRRGWLKHPGRLTALFFIGYGLGRAFAENFREPDAQFITLDNPAGHVIRLGTEWGLTMGQCLSLPMVLIGIGFWMWSRRQPA